MGSLSQSKVEWIACRPSSEFKPSSHTTISWSAAVPLSPGFAKGLIWQSLTLIWSIVELSSLPKGACSNKAAYRIRYLLLFLLQLSCPLQMQVMALLSSDLTLCATCRVHPKSNNICRLCTVSCAFLYRPCEPTSCVAIFIWLITVQDMHTACLPTMPLSSKTAGRWTATPSVEVAQDLSHAQA